MLITPQDHFGSFFNMPQYISKMQHTRRYAHILIRHYPMAQIVAAYFTVLTSKPHDPSTLSQSNPLVFSTSTYPIRICFNIIIQYAVRPPIYCLPLMFSNKNQVYGTLCDANSTKEAWLYPLLTVTFCPLWSSVNVILHNMTKKWCKLFQHFFVKRFCRSCIRHVSDILVHLLQPQSGLIQY